MYGIVVIKPAGTMAFMLLVCLTVPRDSAFDFCLCLLHRPVLSSERYKVSQLTEHFIKIQ